jgi:hypothetical protein
MMKRADFPDRELAERLVDLYFEHANPQMPILHRGDFMELLDRTYELEEKNRSPRAQYVLNIVFAIGAGIIFDDKSQGSDDENRANRNRASSTSKRQRLSSHQYQPEEYHASAIVHLESFLGSSSSEGFGGLEELQAVLLLASFALLRPVAPGLWYIVGVAMPLGYITRMGRGLTPQRRTETRPSHALILAKEDDENGSVTFAAVCGGVSTASTVSLPLVLGDHSVSVIRLSVRICPP